MAKLSVTKNPGKRDLDGGPSKAQLMREVKNLKAGAVERRALSEVITDPEFKNLFTNREAQPSIEQSIRDGGFDDTQPLLCWKEGGFLIDGHTRLAAAREVGLQEVPVKEVSAPDREAAYWYAAGLQLHRRNLSDLERFLWLDRITAGGSQMDKLPGEKGQKTRAKIANLLGISEGQAKKHLAILKALSAGWRAQELREGSLSVNAAYEILQEEKTPQGGRTATPSRKKGKQGGRTATLEEPGSNKGQGGRTATLEDPEPDRGQGGRTATPQAWSAEEDPYILEAAKRLLQENDNRDYRRGIQDLIMELVSAGEIDKKHLDQLEAKE